LMHTICTLLIHFGEFASCDFCSKNISFGNAACYQKNPNGIFLYFLFDRISELFSFVAFGITAWPLGVSAIVRYVRIRYSKVRKSPSIDGRSPVSIRLKDLAPKYVKPDMMLLYDVYLEGENLAL